MITTPERVISEIYQMINRFLWNSNRNKIAKSTMCAQIKYGGLALRNLETTITVSNLNWIKRLYFEENSIPSIFAEFLIGKNMDIKTFIGTKTNFNISQQKKLFLSQGLSRLALHI